MKVGFLAPTALPLATPAFLRAVAQAAEDLGYHAFWAPEHAVLFESYTSRYPYAADGRLVGSPQSGGPIDPFEVLTYVAAVTSRIRLGTGICLVPQRNPVYTAKAVASLDWLSNGRFDFGVGIGWLAEEFAAVGVPFHDRAARTAEYLAVMRALWRDGEAEHHGPLYDLPRCHMDPTPVQRPHPPVYFGGESDAALRRVATIGQGWFGHNLTLEAFTLRVAKLDRMLAEAGRRRAEVQIAVSPAERQPTAALLEQYAGAGADQVVLRVGGQTAASVIGKLQAFAAELRVGA